MLSHPFKISRISEGLRLQNGPRPSPCRAHDGPNADPYHPGVSPGLRAESDGGMCLFRGWRGYHGNAHIPLWCDLPIHAILKPQISPWNPNCEITTIFQFVMRM